MTIAISLKVNDGLVLAADSASTIVGPDPSGDLAVVNVYNNANKVFNLRKGLPIGIITWGAGSIGTASISTLVKDLRILLSRTGAANTDDQWAMDKENYSVLEYAHKVRQFMFEEKYVPSFEKWEPSQRPYLGFIIAGYSFDAAMAEEYVIHIQGDICQGPIPLREPDQIGVTWNGEPEAVSRLLQGYGTRLPEVLHSRLGVSEEQIQPMLAVLQEELMAPVIQPGMPFQDAIDLAEFLVDLTTKFYRFVPGAPTVGGPIEIAGISKHEGFKWISRKHYFGKELNREENYDVGGHWND